MNVTPGEAPIYGGGEIVFDVGEQLRHDGLKYYLVFRGSQVRHVTNAEPVWNHGKLQLKARIPGHAKVETVELCAYSSPIGRGELRLLGSPLPFQYASDSAHQMAKFLCSSVDEPNLLNDLEELCRERFQLSRDVQANLDERLTSAFRAISLPPCWNMMGIKLSMEEEPAERLLHFSARLGLSQLTAHFLTLPGSLAALSSTNHEGLLPEELALRVGFNELAELLLYYRKQDPACSSSKAPALVAKDNHHSPAVITTNLNWNNRDLEYDVSELDKLNTELSKKTYSPVIDTESMGEQRTIKRGASEPEALNKNGEENADFTPDTSSSHRRTPHAPGRILEDNLRRLRGIHEGIQKIRENNTRQMVNHVSQKRAPSRLSNSCPVLSAASALPDHAVSAQNKASCNMRTFLNRRTSLSSNSRSLDSTFFEAINVKIRINDITPSVSQEFLQQTSPVNEDETFHFEKVVLKNGGNHCESTNIGGTASRRLAKKSGKKGPVRRQSWSSLGASTSPETKDEKQDSPRRWSLSSLDSEEAFSDPNERGQTHHQEFSPSSLSGNESFGAESCRAKVQALLAGSGEESSLSKSAKQSASVPSMRDITVDIKENVEPEKPHSTGSLSSTAKSFLATFRSNPLQKSLSTPAITLDDELQEKAKQETSNGQSVCVMPVRSDGPVSLGHENENKIANTYQPISLAGVLRESQHHPVMADSDEEKPFSKRKKRSSIFFKKKPDKNKNKDSRKTPHQFIAWQGSSANCDVCHKPFVKKQGLKCENCLVLVHDSSCKDQVIDCNKFKLQAAQAKPNYLPVNKDMFSLPSGTNVSTPSGQNKSSSLQQAVKDKYNIPTFHGHSGIPSLCEAATRSSFINLGKMISEECDHDGHDLQSNMVETNSVSVESLDEGALEISDLEDNHILRLTDEEPENWNALVDKKVAKKLKDKEVKRQEAIYELIITEKHHCLTLEIMQKVYAQGMMKELNMSRESVERIFPCLSELLEFHKAFLCRLRERQSESPVVQNITDILEEQFQDQRAEQMRDAYGQFCSQHIEALNLYKEWSKSDRKFQNFIKRCSSKRLCKAKGIPECLLLVTQRITKYILLIESLIKSSKDSKEEHQALINVLDNLKEIIWQVNVQVAVKEKELRLLEISNKMDPKAAVFYRGKKFKRSDLMTNKRKLVKEGPLIWKSPKGKTIEVLAVMVSDFILFLHENNQKYGFASLENKPGIVSLQKLLVRKKAGQDSRGMYLISSNPSKPEMIELLCRTSKDQKAWMEAVREAVEHCPDEDEGIPSETEEERKLEATRTARVKELMGLLHEKDVNVAQLCEEKMRLMVDMMEVVGVDVEQYENIKYSHLVENDFGSGTKEFLSSAISNASRLANSLYASGTNLSRSVSSAGEHQSETYVSPLLPKRAETFGGFDNPSKEPVIPTKVPALKKKLLHLKEHTEPMNILPSKTVLEHDFELGDSLEIALRGFDSKTRTLSRPSSICGSPDKQHYRKNSSAPSISPQNSLSPYQEVSSDLLRFTPTPLLVSQGKDQLMQIVELAHHLNTVTCTVSHLASVTESLKIQLAQANDKISKLAKEKEVRDRRPLYRPEHQLEELRNLQKQLNHDKAVWQQEKTQHENDLRTQKEELERLQEQLKSEQTDVTHQRELLYRKLDALQKQGIILSPSHTVLNNCAPRDADVHKDELRSVSMDVPNTATPDFLQHRRTFSCDFHPENRDHGSLPSTNGASVFRNESKSKLSSNSSLSAANKTIPLHLSNSATNLQKRQSMSSHSIKQQLPLKLASSNTANGGSNHASQGAPPQVIPLKLALGGVLPTSAPLETKNSAPKRSHSAASSPSSTLTAPVHVRGGSSPALVTYPPNAELSMSPNGGKHESFFHQLKVTAEKTKNNKKERDSNEEIFC